MLNNYSCKKTPQEGNFYGGLHKIKYYDICKRKLNEKLPNQWNKAIDFPLDKK